MKRISREQRLGERHLHVRRAGHEDLRVAALLVGDLLDLRREPARDEVAIRDAVEVGEQRRRACRRPLIRLSA